MIIACPACSASYSVPVTAIPPTGRKLRCSACGHEWLEGAPAEEARAALAAANAVPAAVHAFAPEAATPERVKLVATPPAPARDWGAVVAVVLFALIGFVGLLVVLRGPIGHAVPAMADLYETVGMPIETVDQWFERGDLRPEPVVENGEQVLHVYGSYTNTSRRARDVPTIKLFWIDADQKISSVVRVTPARDRLAAGEKTDFIGILSGIDTSAGGQVGAVLVGGPLDAELEKTLARQQKNLAKPTENKKADAAAKPAAPHDAGHGH